MHVVPHSVERQHCRGVEQSKFVVHRKGVFMQALRLSGLDGDGQPLGLITTNVNKQIKITKQKI